MSLDPLTAAAMLDALPTAAVGSDLFPVLAQRVARTRRALLERAT